MAMFTLPQMIQRLTRGFVKVTGRMPDGLEKIKIKQEALEKIKQQDKVVDMQGNVIDTSKGIMGGKQVGMFDNIFNRMQKDMGKGNPKIVKPKKPDPEEKAMGGRIGFFGGGAGKYQMDLPFGKPLFTMVMNNKLYGIYQNKDGSRLSVPLGSDGKPSYAEGGRIGLKAGMSRRTFLKLMGGVGAGIGALKTGILKLAGKEGARQVTKNIIKTDALPNKPEWFDALVTKVINEGEDITKKFSTGERQTVHKLDVDSFTDSKGNKVITEEVRVTQDPDTGEIRVEYLTPDSPGESQVDLVYKKPKPDEGDPNPSAEFYAVESEPRVVNYDGDIEFDGENLVSNVDELMTDTTKLKMIAKGDNKPTLKEFVQSKKKKDQVERLNTDTMNQVDYIETKYGPGPDPSDYVDDMAKGGLAGMLGE